MFKEIETKEEYITLINNGAISIDVRSTPEYSESKIPNIKTGFDWNNGEFHDNFDQLDPENSYILVCRSGNRSMQACMFLASQGFQNLYNLKGGMMGWNGETC